MPKLSASHKQKSSYIQKNSWLPIDERLIPHIIEFGHVKGITRIFLEFEIAMSLLVVLITVIFTVAKLFS
jgi:hypothetical protein